MDDLKLGSMHVNKKAVMVAAVFAGGVVAYAYYTRSSRGGGGDAAPSGGPDPSIDPFTGLPYADEFNMGTAGQGPSYQGIYDPATGQWITPGSQTVTGYGSNAEWSQKALLVLTATGYDGVAVSGALGNALNGVAVTNDQLNMFNTARALVGEPPYPFPAIVHAGTPGSGTTPVTSVGKVTGLHASHIDRTAVTLEWTKVPHAVGYQMSRNGSVFQSVVYSKGSVYGLRPNTTYTLGVRAIGPGSKFYGPIATVHVRTHK